MTRSTMLVHRLRSVAAAALFTVLVTISLGAGPASALVPAPDPSGDPAAPARVLSPTGPASESAQTGLNVGLSAVLVITAALMVVGAVAWARAARRNQPRAAA